MATNKPREREDAPGVVPEVLKQHVAAAFAFDQLEKQMGTLREWLEMHSDAPHRIYAVMSATQLAVELVQRLTAMQITLAGEL
jgi:hypothetical protein